MDLSILIKILLNEHETVIIPGFGAFISVYRPAVVRENDIIPPGKEIRFFNQIKNNDGLLAMHIARSKKISYDDAFKRIERATTKIIYQLDKGEKVTFGELGEFSYNENGEIQFAPFESETLVVPAGFEPVSFDDVEETYEEVDAAQVSETQQPVAEAIEDTGNLLQDSAGTNNSPEADPETKTTVAAPEPKITAPEIQPEQTVQPVERKKTLAWLWIVLLVLAILAVVYLMFNNQKNTTGETPPEKADAGIVQPAVIPTDSVQTADTVVAAVEQPQPDVSVPKYHLVGGGFKSEENALKYINQLREKGIEGQLLGQNGNIFIVGIASFTTEQEAYNELNRRMRENPEWKIWVYKK